MIDVLTIEINPRADKRVETTASPRPAEAEHASDSQISEVLGFGNLLGLLEGLSHNSGRDNTTPPAASTLDALERRVTIDSSSCDHPMIDAAAIRQGPSQHGAPPDVARDTSIERKLIEARVRSPAFADISTVRHEVFIRPTDAHRLADVLGTLEHFPTKWEPVRRQEMRYDNNIERRADSFGSKSALEAERPPSSHGSGGVSLPPRVRDDVLRPLSLQPASAVGRDPQERGAEWIGAPRSALGTSDVVASRPFRSSNVATLTSSPVEKKADVSSTSTSPVMPLLCNVSAQLEPPNPIDEPRTIHVTSHVSVGSFESAPTRIDRLEVGLADQHGPIRTASLSLKDGMIEVSLRVETEHSGRLELPEAPALLDALQQMGHPVESVSIASIKTSTTDPHLSALPSAHDGASLGGQGDRQSHHSRTHEQLMPHSEPADTSALDLKQTEQMRRVV